MRAVVIVLLFFGLVLAYRAGQQVQAFAQSRADVRDQRAKVRKCVKARRSAAVSAVAGWTALAGALLLVGAALIGGR